MPRLTIALLLAVACSLPLTPRAAGAQVPCREIRFPAGASAGVIEGQIPPDGQLCYVIAVGDGQRAEARIDGPEQQFPIVMVDGVTGEGGDQAAVWQTRAGRYEIRVMTLFRYGAPTPFRLQVSVTGG